MRRPPSPNEAGGAQCFSPAYAIGQPTAIEFRDASVLRFIITVTYGSAEPHSPPRRGGEDAPPIRWREATESGADGVVRPARPGFRRTDHPALRATLLCEEGNSSTQFSNATLAFVRR